jgi:hypothetical protein
MSCCYFFLRPRKPAAMEPNPSKPSSGSGEAVWGSFWPAFAFWSAAAVLSAAVAFLSLSLSAEVALWSAAAALLAGAAFWSAGAVVVAGAVLLAAAFWSVLLGVCAGGFTGALALSPALPAGLLVVAAGAFALFASVVGVWLLPEATDGLLLAALWSVELAGAVVLVAAADEAAEESDGAALDAWLLVQESEIMFTELT